MNEQGSNSNSTSYAGRGMQEIVKEASSTAMRGPTLISPSLAHPPTSEGDTYGKTHECTYGFRMKCAWIAYGTFSVAF